MNSILQYSSFLQVQHVLVLLVLGSPKLDTGVPCWILVNLSAGAPMSSLQSCSPDVGSLPVLVLGIFLLQRLEFALAFFWTSWSSWGSFKSPGLITLNPKWTEFFIHYKKKGGGEEAKQSNENRFSFRWFLEALQTCEAAFYLPLSNVWMKLGSVIKSQRSLVAPHAVSIFM